jgi:hypothetical protein
MNSHDEHGAETRQHLEEKGGIGRASFSGSSQRGFL